MNMEQDNAAFEFAVEGLFGQLPPSKLFMKEEVENKTTEQDNVAFDYALEGASGQLPPSKSSLNEEEEIKTMEQDNAAFDSGLKGATGQLSPAKTSLNEVEENKDNADLEQGRTDDVPGRPTWGNQLEFLMSCIATSVGLGNIWRFPFVAYQNGGGAFIILYVIVLGLIGCPIYYLECALGQFSSRNSVKIWASVPALKGIGYAQALGCGFLLTYYMSIIGLCLYYLTFSFGSTLPWAECNEEWTDVVCIPSSQTEYVNSSIENAVSSAHLYFKRTVLQQADSIDDGLGSPIWYLTLYLLAAWIMVFCIVARGVGSSGKASYILALFPFFNMLLLFIGTAVHPGAFTGILFFLMPQWHKLLSFDALYAAITQVFFSLTVCTGPIIMYSSYNDFRQNITRNVCIVTILDTCTSLISGVTIFGMLGILANVMQSDVVDVIGSGGTSLAFMTYPDAMAKFPAPQFFTIMFFVMMAVLGVGSSVALLSTITTVVLDAISNMSAVQVSAITCVVGFLAGLVFVTPGGQWALQLVDYYGVTFIILFAGISQIIGVIWFYGLENLCLDIEFMSGTRTSIYWRLCWGIFTPLGMIAAFVYACCFSNKLEFEGKVYPAAGYVSGYLMPAIAIALILIFIGVAMYRNRSGNIIETFKGAFRQKSTWGPRDPIIKEQWRSFKLEAKAERQERTVSRCKHIWLSLLGSHRKTLRPECTDLQLDHIT